MITVRVCDKLAHKPFDRFVQKDGTTTYVRVPRAEQGRAQLMVFSEQPDFHACIEVDGEELMCVPLDAPQVAIELPQAEKKSGPSFLKLHNLFGGKGNSGGSSPASFTVLIRRGSSEGQVIGTYNFQILDDIAYATTLEAKLQEASERNIAPPVVFSTDHRLPGSVRTCWNCSTPLSGDCCSNCGCCQDSEQ
ncbi:MAG TPA: hypothetical protein V6D08_00680 [Candidatus Obscuribacterales bacterium]